MDHSPSFLLDRPCTGSQTFTRPRPLPFKRLLFCPQIYSFPNPRSSYPIICLPSKPSPTVFGIRYHAVSFFGPFCLFWRLRNPQPDLQLPPPPQSCYSPVWHTRLRFFPTLHHIFTAEGKALSGKSNNLRLISFPIYPSLSLYSFPVTLATGHIHFFFTSLLLPLSRFKFVPIIHEKHLFFSPQISCTMRCGSQNVPPPSGMFTHLSGFFPTPLLFIPPVHSVNGRYNQIVPNTPRVLFRAPGGSGFFPLWGLLPWRITVPGNPTLTFSCSIPTFPA